MVFARFILFIAALFGNQFFGCMAMGNSINIPGIFPSKAEMYIDCDDNKILMLKESFIIDGSNISILYDMCTSDHQGYVIYRALMSQKFDSGDVVECFIVLWIGNDGIIREIIDMNLNQKDIESVLKLMHKRI